MLDGLQENLARLMSEEQLEMATLLNLFTKNPDDKKAARQIHKEQTKYIRRKQNYIRRLLDVDKEKPEIEPFDPSLYFEDEKDDIKRWFEEQGIEAR